MSKVVDVLCAHCGKQYSKNKYEYLRWIKKDSNRKFYCSHSCVGASSKNPPSICVICGKEYPCISKNKTTKYCSRACSNKGRIGLQYTGEQKKSKVFNVKGLKFTIAIRDGGFCSKCRCDNFSLIDVHHILPRSKGGTDDLNNLTLLCKNCHSMQHHPSFTFEEFKKQFEEENYRMMVYKARLELAKYNKEEKRKKQEQDRIERGQRRAERSLQPKPKRSKKLYPIHTCQTCNKETTNKTYCSYACSHKSTHRFDISKEDLEALINEKPMSTIAKDLGVSDTAVKKRAKKLGIELKSMRGVWAKRQAKDKLPKVHKLF